jgi:hypothetical protein
MEQFTDTVVSREAVDAVVVCLLDDPQRLDRELLSWELNRDKECLPSYYLGQRETRTDPINQLHAEMYRELDADANVADQFIDLLADAGISGEFMQVVARQRDPRKFFTPRRLTRWAWRAACRPHADRAALAREVLDELRYEVLLRRDLAIVHCGWRADVRGFSRRGGNGWSPQTLLRRLHTTTKVGAA